jgi:hypothetical protein
MPNEEEVKEEEEEKGKLTLLVYAAFLLFSWLSIECFRSLIAALDIDPDGIFVGQSVCLSVYIWRTKFPKINLLSDGGVELACGGYYAILCSGFCRMLQYTIYRDGQIRGGEKMNK